MPDQPPFDAAEAAASLPNLPAPDPVRGPDIATARFGDVALRLLSDGSMSLPFRVLGPTAPEGELEQLCGLDRAPHLAQGELTHAVLETGEDLILVETGAGPGWQAGTGRLLRHMEINGIAPGDITKVVLTHLHPDHSWGTITETGALAFPNATYHVGRSDIGFWGNPALPEKVSARFRDTILTTQRVLSAIGDRLVPVAEGDSVAEGISILDTPGHTPGHISLFVEGGPGLIVTGDAVVNDIVSFARPDWTFGFDMDDDGALTSRRRLLDMAVAGGHAMFGYHWTWPGLGHADRAAGAYRFVPGGT